MLDHDLQFTLVSVVSSVLFLLLCKKLYDCNRWKTAIVFATAANADIYFHAVTREKESIIVHTVITPCMVLAVSSSLLFMLVNRPFTHFPVAVLSAVGLVWSMICLDEPDMLSYDYSFYSLPSHTQKNFKASHLLQHAFATVLMILVTNCAMLERE